MMALTRMPLPPERYGIVADHGVEATLDRVIADGLGAADEFGIDRTDHADGAVAVVDELGRKALDQVTRGGQPDLDLAGPGIAFPANRWLSTR